nr:hypothetical protein F09C12.3 - Caenorhabditis elegans [Caenorhabditis elegans]
MELIGHWMLQVFLVLHLCYLAASLLQKNRKIIWIEETSTEYEKDTVRNDDLFRKFETSELSDSSSKLDDKDRIVRLRKSRQELRKTSKDDDRGV